MKKVFRSQIKLLIFVASTIERKISEGLPIEAHFQVTQMSFAYLSNLPAVVVHLLQI